MTVNRDRHTRDRHWLFVGHVLFFGALYFVYSPVFTLPNPIRFGGFAALLVGGAALITEASFHRLERYGWLILAFLILYGIAALRMNEMIPEKAGDTILLNYQMAVLSMLAFVTSVAISANVDLLLMRRALLLVSVPCGLWICYNHRELSDYTSSATYTLGSLNYSSYQLTSLLLAIGSLSALAEVDFKRLMSWKSLLATPVFLLFGYFVFQGLGRGEALAFALAVTFYLVPRVSLLTLPFAYSITLFLVNSFNTPLTERMQFVLDGNYGARDELLGYSWTLLENEPLTVLVGGGLNYFQSYWNFSSGTYPHNIPVETLISGGILLFGLYFLVYFVPVLRGLFLVLSRRFSRETSYALCLAVMLLLITFKSGTLLTFWTLGMFTCVFLHLNTIGLASRRPQTPLGSTPSGRYGQPYPPQQFGNPSGSSQQQHGVAGLHRHYHQPRNYS